MATLEPYEGGEFGLAGTIYKTDANGDNHEAVFGPKADWGKPSGKLLEVSGGVCCWTDVMEAPHLTESYLNTI